MDSAIEAMLSRYDPRNNSEREKCFEGDHSGDRTCRIIPGRIL